MLAERPTRSQVWLSVGVEMQVAQGVAVFRFQQNQNLPTSTLRCTIFFVLILIFIRREVLPLHNKRAATCETVDAATTLKEDKSSPVSCFIFVHQKTSPLMPRESDDRHSKTEAASWARVQVPRATYEHQSFEIE